MRRNRKGFTLIELLITICIIGILAVIALPKYFANIEKARKAEAYSSLNSIREVLAGYAAANPTGAFPTANSFPITVVVDGATVLSLNRPSSASFTYTYTATDCVATKVAGMGNFTYTMNISTGAVTTS